MAPKKIEEPEKKPLIGRVGTNLKIGIVGVPNVGKVRENQIYKIELSPTSYFPVDILQCHHQVSSTC
jgi:obg-like ATPase 1